MTSKSLDKLYDEVMEFVTGRDASKQDVFDEDESSERYRDLQRRVFATWYSGRTSEYSGRTSFGAYPDVTAPDFQRRLFAKREFRQFVDRTRAVRKLRETSETCGVLNQEFRLTLQQMFLKAYVSPATPYSGLLLFHSVGTGKTCSAITIADQFPHKRVYVLVWQDSLKESFRQQIFDASKIAVNADTGAVSSRQCTGSRYLPPDLRMYTADEVREHAYRAIQERYKFIGMIEFANYVSKVLKEYMGRQKLSDVFDDSVFVIDEAHHLRSNADLKFVPPMIEAVIRSCRNVRLLLLTATPMFNSPTDLVGLLNLLLLNDKRPTLQESDLFGPDERLTRDGARVLSSMCATYVSYQSADQSDATLFPKRVYAGSAPLRARSNPWSDQNSDQKVAKDSKLKLVQSAMSRAQRAVYDAIVRARIEKRRVTRNAVDEQDPTVAQASTTKDTIAFGATFNSEQQAANVVYYHNYQKYDAEGREPASQYIGMAGFRKTFKVASGHQQQLKVQYIDDKHRILDSSMLQSASAKIHAIVQHVLRSTGIVVVYSRFIASGIIPLAIALEHAGFDRHNGNILQLDEKYKLIDRHNKHKHKYAVISSDLFMDRVLTADVAADLRVINAPDNLHGERIKVVLLSDVAVEGINIYRVRELHVMEPWYNLNKINQVVGRAYRRCSHADLPVSERTMTVHLHAVTCSDDKNMDTSIDTYLYRLAERKQDGIARVEDEIKRSALDAFFDPGFGRADSTAELDSTTFDPLVDDLDAETAAAEISASAVLGMTFDQIAALHPDRRRETVVAALQLLLTAGSLYYRSGLYWDESANTANRRGPQLTERRVLLSKSDLQPSKSRSNESVSKSKSTTSTSNLIAKLGERIDGISHLMARHVDGNESNKTSMKHACVDYYLDRLNEAELRKVMRAVYRMRTAKEEDDLQERPLQERLLLKRFEASLRSGGVLWFFKGDAYFFDYFSKRLMCMDPSKGDFVPCQGVRSEEATASILADPGLLRKMKTVPGAKAVLAVADHHHVRFKIIDETCMKGCVCVQTSTIRADRIQEYIRRIKNTNNKDVGNNLPTDKAQICSLYELVLRSFAPDLIVRPAIYAWTSVFVDLLNKK